MMKNSRIFLLIAVMTMLSGVYAQTEPFPYDIPSQTQISSQDEPTDISQVIKDDSLTPSNSIMNRLTNFFRVSGTSYNPDNTGSPAINYIKWILNMVLALVSFIALVLIIFAFYLIFFGKADDAVKKARKILTGVAIALVIMGLSRLIVSFFFDVFTTVT